MTTEPIIFRTHLPEYVWVDSSIFGDNCMGILRYVEVLEELVIFHVRLELEDDHPAVQYIRADGFVDVEQAEFLDEVPGARDQQGNELRLAFIARANGVLAERSRLSAQAEEDARRVRVDAARAERRSTGHTLFPELDVGLRNQR